MRSKLLDRNGGATYILVFDPGDEVMSGLTTFAKDHGLEASDFTALGAFSSALLGFFDVEQKEYQKIPVNEQVEVLTLVGNVTLDKQEPRCTPTWCLAAPTVRLAVGISSKAARGQRWS